MQSALDLKCDSPLELARIIKYYGQEFIPNKRSIPYAMIKAKTDYEKSKRLYDKLYNICIKYGVNVIDFVKYSILMAGKTAVGDMLNVGLFLSYANYKKREKRYSDIYKNFIKSANNIADMCITNGYSGTAECMRHLIADDRLGYEYFAGKISKYYLAAFGNFSEMVEKTTGQTRDELSIICDIEEELCRDVQDAFLEFTNKPVSPVQFTDKLIEDKKHKHNSTTIKQ